MVPLSSPGTGFQIPPGKCFLSPGVYRPHGGPSGVWGPGRDSARVRLTRPACLPAVAPTRRWSMQVPAEVSATAGEAAVLPCTFTHPHRHYDGPLTAIWRAGEPYAGPQVFRCTAERGSEHCETALSLHGRFRLLGNPRRNDLSLRVERPALADSGRYFCRVEFTGDIHDRYESRHGVWLRVTGERSGPELPAAGGAPPSAPPRPVRRESCSGPEWEQRAPLPPERGGVGGRGALSPGGGGYGPPENLSNMPNAGPGGAGAGGNGHVTKGEKVPRDSPGRATNGCTGTLMG